MVPENSSATYSQAHNLGQGCSHHSIGAPERCTWRQVPSPTSPPILPEIGRTRRVPHLLRTLIVRDENGLEGDTKYRCAWIALCIANVIFLFEDVLVQGIEVIYFLM